MTQRVEKGLGSDFHHTDAEKRWFIDSFGLREEWYTFLVTLEHIQFERMDDEQEFDGMMLRLVDRDGDPSCMQKWNRNPACRNEIENTNEVSQF